MVGKRIVPLLILYSFLTPLSDPIESLLYAQEPTADDLFADVFGEPAAQDLVLPLFRGDEFLGDLQARVNGNEVRISAAALETLVEPFFDQAAIQAIADIESTDGLVSLGAFEAVGLFLVYRRERAEINLSVAPERLRERVVGAGDRRSPPNLQDPTLFSGYTNAFIRAVVSSEEEVSVAAVRLEPVLNYDGWVLEASMGITTASLTQASVDDDPLSLQYLRLVRDLSDFRIRGEAGLVRYQHGTLFSGPDVLGFSVTRMEEIGNDTSLFRNRDLRFVVSRHAPVDIYLNERVYRREVLNEGPHRITDLPLGSGINTVRVEQARADAAMPPEIVFDEVLSFAPDLVQPGRHLYSWSLGLLRDQYSADALFLSGTHRTGVAPQWTIGADLQAGIEEYAVGLYSLNASRFGRSRVEGAVTFDIEGTVGTAMDLSHLFSLLYTRRWPAVELSVTVESPDYNRVSTRPTETGRLRGGVSINHRLRDGLNATVGIIHNRRIAGDEQNESTLRVSLSHRSTRGFSLNALVSPTFTGDEVYWRGGLFVRFGSEDGSLNTSVGYDPVQNSSSLEVANVPDRMFRELHWSADYRRSAGIEDEVHVVGGSVRYDMYRGSAQAQPEVLLRPTDQDEARLTAHYSTGLAWAGTTVAMTRPIRDSFAIFVPRPEVADYRLPLRPGAGAPAAEISGRAAVVPDLISWRTTTVRVDGTYLPDGLSVGDRDVSFFPRYRSGYRIVVGSAASVYVVGRLVDAATGRPIALEAGEIVAVEDATIRELFFTNREGRFEIAELRPGRYHIQLLQRPDVELVFDIPADVSGRFDLDDVILLDEGGS